MPIDVSVPDSVGKQRSVLRHAVMNLAGLGLPLIAAVFTIPVLIRHLGNERFGLLTLIWAIVGYFGLFDFGLGRALTQQLSMLIARKQQAKARKLVHCSWGAYYLRSAHEITIV